MLEKSTGPHLALLSHRSTGLSWCNLSPAQLLMGRRIRSTVPEISKNFLQDWAYVSQKILRPRKTIQSVAGEVP